MADLAVKHNLEENKMAYGDPYTTTAKYRSTCPKCGQPIKSCEMVTIWPRNTKGRKAYHAECSEADMAAFEASRFDEASYSGTWS